MKPLIYIALGTAVLTLSGCTLNEKNFLANREIGRQHPELHAGALARCERKIYYLPIEAKRYMAGYIHTDVKSAPATICRRMLKGYLSGRMQWVDLKTLIERNMFTPTMTQILRAK